jgi:low affinity Fe/Cu permease
MHMPRQYTKVSDRTAGHDAPQLPSEVSSRVGFFDRFAGSAALVASRAPFFAICLILVIVWLAQGFVTVAATGNWSKFISSTYQLEINTTTTIITFLMVALLQNSQTRNDLATQHKLNAIADALADLMEHVATEDRNALDKDIHELKLAVGIEERESTTHNQKQDEDSGAGSESAVKHPPARQPSMR